CERKILHVSAGCDGDAAALLGGFEQYGLQVGSAEHQIWSAPALPRHVKRHFCQRAKIAGAADDYAARLNSPLSHLFQYIKACEKPRCIWRQLETCAEFLDAPGALENGDRESFGR